MLASAARVLGAEVAPAGALGDLGQRLLVDVAPAPFVAGGRTAGRRPGTARCRWCRRRSCTRARRGRAPARRAVSGIDRAAVVDAVGEQDHHLALAPRSRSRLTAVARPMPIAVPSSTMPKSSWRRRSDDHVVVERERPLGEGGGRRRPRARGDRAGAGGRTPRPPAWRPRGGCRAASPRPRIEVETSMASTMSTPRPSARSGARPAAGAPARR